jgi:hypothetical protein
LLTLIGRGGHDERVKAAQRTQAYADISGALADHIGLRNALWIGAAGLALSPVLLLGQTRTADIHSDETLRNEVLIASDLG